MLVDKKNNNKKAITKPTYLKVTLPGVGFEPTQSYDYESLNLTP